MSNSDEQYHVGDDSLFKNLVFLPILTNLCAMVYAFYFELQPLFYVNILLITIGVIGYLIYMHISKTYGYHSIIIGYLLIFPLASQVGANYYASVNLFVVAFVVPLLFTKSRATHIFYFSFALSSCLYFIYFLPEVQFREEPYRHIAEAIIATGVMLVIFQMIRYFIFKIQKSEKQLKEQNLVIEQQVQEMHEKNKDLEKYIQSNIQLEQFAHIASHDLKSPLRTISSFSGLLKRKIYDTSDASTREHMDFIEQAAKKMSLLVNDLLEYSKVNSLELKKETISMDKIVYEVLDSISHDISESRAVIHVGDLPRDINVDPVKLSQVFLNLITNSIKFTKPNTLPHITIDSFLEGNYYHIIVTDNGLGVKPDFIDNIFKPFQKLHTEKEFEGTGMGLSICQKIIAQHDGQIWLDQNYQGGAKFEFTLPASQ